MMKHPFGWPAVRRPTHCNFVFLTLTLIYSPARRAHVSLARCQVRGIMPERVHSRMAGLRGFGPSESLLVVGRSKG